MNQLRDERLTMFCGIVWLNVEGKRNGDTVAVYFSIWYLKMFGVAPCGC